MTVPRSDPAATMTEGDVAHRLGASASTLRKWRKLGIGPGFLRYGTRMIRYPSEEVEKFMRARGREA